RKTDLKLGTSLLSRAVSRVASPQARRRGGSTDLVIENVDGEDGSILTKPSTLSGSRKVPLTSTEVAASARDTALNAIAAFEKTLAERNRVNNGDAARRDAKLDEKYSAPSALPPPLSA